MIKKKSGGIFFGWWTVLAGGFLALWGWGYYLSGMSALFKPIASELGLSRAVTSVATGIGRFGGGVEAPIAGWVTDKFGPRWVITFGAFLAGLGLVIMYFIQSVWAYYIAWGVILGTGTNLSLTLPQDKAITNWFVKKRGLAQGIRGIFTGLAPVVGLPIVTWLIVTQGWRMSCLVGGIVMWVVGVPLAWFLIKQQRPEYYGLLPDGAVAREETAKDVDGMIGRGVAYATEVEEVEFTLRQAVRTPTYWLFTVAYTAQGLSIPVVITHIIPLLTDMGVDPVKAAMMVSIANAISIPMRFFGGFIADHVNKSNLRLLLAGAFFIQCAGVAAFVMRPTLVMAYPFLILFYLGLGASIPLSATLRARYFGRKAFGSIGGLSMMLGTPFAVVSPIYAGWIFDTTGSYLTAFTTFAICLGVAAVTMTFALAPKPPAQVTDIRKIM
ncbi:MAG: MFS transporter [Chloroflexota bacterium]